MTDEDSRHIADVMDNPEWSEEDIRKGLRLKDFNPTLAGKIQALRVLAANRDGLVAAAEQDMIDAGYTNFEVRSSGKEDRIELRDVATAKIYALQLKQDDEGHTIVTPLPPLGEKTPAAVSFASEFVRRIRLRVNQR